MNISITGHRPERLNDQDRICHDLTMMLEDLGCFRLIQGMAPGADLLAARTAYRAGIPYLCAKPYPSHRNYVENNYPGWLGMYDRALEHADEIVTVSNNYTKSAFQDRNIWMVDHGDEVVAVWDGVKKGGTWNCLSYALNQSKGIHVINP